MWTSVVADAAQVVALDSSSAVFSQQLKVLVENAQLLGRG
jgi:hypothetical protein